MKRSSCIAASAMHGDCGEVANQRATKPRENGNNLM